MPGVQASGQRSGISVGSAADSEDPHVAVLPLDLRLGLCPSRRTNCTAWLAHPLARLHRGVLAKHTSAIRLVSPSKAFDHPARGRRARDVDGAPSRPGCSARMMGTTAGRTSRGSRHHRRSAPGIVVHRIRLRGKADSFQRRTPRRSAGSRCPGADEVGGRHPDVGGGRTARRCPRAPAHLVQSAGDLEAGRALRRPAGDNPAAPDRPCAPRSRRSRRAMPDVMYVLAPLTT